jgi:glucuronoarabinoxylan endo-1,4-beta-xylanase
MKIRVYGFFAVMSALSVACSGAQTETGGETGGGGSLGSSGSGGSPAKSDGSGPVGPASGGSPATVDASSGNASAEDGAPRMAMSDGASSTTDGRTGAQGRRDAGVVARDASSGPGSIDVIPADAGPFDAGKVPGTAPANAVIVDPGIYHQRIAGFGASSAWEGNYKNANDPNDLFSTTGNGAGLSLFRVRIQPSPAGTTSNGEIQMALKAQALGATVWATPWTPPPADKSNNSTVEGTLTNPAAWAATLASYVDKMKTAGINLYAVSANNEPDANVTYESCSYNGTTMAAFVGTSLGPALAPKGVKLMMPETQNWFGFANFEPALEANAAAWAATQIVATHEYGGNPAAFPRIQAAGKEFWETEWFSAGGEDATMTNGLVIANTIYQALTVANMSAWHYWWFYPASNDNGALWDNGVNTWAKRMWVMGNFSRWARPGSYRVDVSGPRPAGISVVAFQSPAVPLFVRGTSWPASVVPWVTSDTANIAAGAAIPVAAGSFSAQVPARSVTTFTGTP